MRILFGPDHDGLHISPETPGAYEWWYFDALSDDGRFALVAIFFLGTPMSPYYKAVVDGKNPLPKDWCGVFFSLHELVERRVDGNNSYGRFWKERAYAYNIYRDGQFADEPLRVKIGNSYLCKVTSSDGQQAWHLQIEERGLWRHTLRADLHFTVPSPPLSLPEQGEQDNAHTWVCTAPVCQMTGTVTLPDKEIPLHSTGYHDHNFGQLPWHDVDIWYWGRIPIEDIKGLTDGSRIFWSLEEMEAVPHPGTLVFYRVEKDDNAQETILLFNSNGLYESSVTFSAHSGSEEVPTQFGFWHKPYFLCNVIAGGKRRNLIQYSFETATRWNDKPFSYGPFYRRIVVWAESLDVARDGTAGYHGTGIGEVFRPARLCGPIASRAMWTRTRRRS